MKTEELDYDLPESAIAQRPLAHRDGSRLLRLDRVSGAMEHHLFRDLPRLLPRSSLLVVNDTRVFPARLIGRRPTGGKAELLLLHREGGQGERWRCLGKPRRKLRPGTVVTVGELRATVVEWQGDEVVVELDTAGDLFETLERLGHVPLPPYIRRPDEGEDRQRYQTVYAGPSRGSVAAPTAGLHFTEALLEALEREGHRRTAVTLHVGAGTFLPVRVEDLSDHVMHREWFEVSQEAAEEIEAARAEGRPIVAVGTTVVRTLESAVDERGRVRAQRGTTDLFITPGFRFKVIDGLITNFHLPRSTLLALVFAFAGRDAVLGAYEEALRRGYRFYSYGDAMLIL